MKIGELFILCRNGHIEFNEAMIFFSKLIEIITDEGVFCSRESEISISNQLKLKFDIESSIEIEEFLHFSANIPELNSLFKLITSINNYTLQMTPEFKLSRTSETDLKDKNSQYSIESTSSNGNSNF